MASPQKGGIGGHQMSGQGRTKTSKMNIHASAAGLAPNPGTKPAQKGDLKTSSLKPGKTASKPMRTGPSRY